MTHPGHDARRQVAADNPWYVDDQFRAQLEPAGSRLRIEHRWNAFEAAITEWRGGYPAAHTRLTLLDAGCGDGLNLAALAGIIRRADTDANIYGCDYNNLRIARANTIAGVNGVFLASLTAAPAADTVFDLILCNHVLEHIPDSAGALAELYRILKPGGLLIAGVPNEGCALARLRNHVTQPAIARTTDHVHFFTGPTLAALIERAGFRVTGLTREGFFVPHLRLSNWLSEGRAGRAVIAAALKAFPSQAAGLICFAERA